MKRYFYSIIGNNSRIRILAIWISFILIIIVSSIIFYRSERKDAISLLKKDIKSTTSAKVTRIIEWHKNRLADAQMFSQSPFFVSAVNEYIKRNDQDLNSKIEKRLNLINTNNHYTALAIIDRNSNIIINVGDSIDKIDTLTKEYVTRVFNEKKILFTDFYECKTHNSLHLDYIAPLANDNDSTIFAAIIFRVIPHEKLNAIIDNSQNGDDNNKSNYIVKRDNKNVYVYNADYPASSKHIYAIRNSNNNCPFVKAVNYQSTIIQAENKNEEELFVYSESIPNTPWVYLRTIHESELSNYLLIDLITIIIFDLFLLLLFTLVVVAYYFNVKKGEFIKLLIKERRLSNYYKEFQTILYSIGDGVITTDINGCITKMNYVAENLTGWKENEAFGKHIDDVFSITNQTTKVKVENPIHQVLRTQEIIGLSNSVYLVNKNGNQIPIADTASPIYGSKNEMQGVVLVIRDRTNDHQAAKKLRESETRYQMLFNNMTQGFALHQIILNESGKPIDYKFIDANVAYEGLTGLKAMDIAGRTAKEILPELEDYWIETFGNVALTGKSIRYQNYSHEIDKYFDVWAFSPQEGQFAVIISDITDRKKTEEKLQILTKGIEQSPVIAVITDTKGIIEYVNTRFVEVTGYLHDEVIGKNINILKSGYHNKGFYNHLWETILKGNDWKGEIQNRKKSGELYWESALISSIKNEKGEILHFIALKEDITAKKLTEIELQERDIMLKEQNEEYLIVNKELTESYERIKAINTELERAREKAVENDKLKTAFLANMSHEIRTPMNGIIGFAELLKNKALSEDERLGYIKIIEESGQRLLDLINNLIDVSKIEAGQINKTITSVNVKKEILLLYNFFKLETDRKKIKLTIQQGDELQLITLLSDKQKFLSIASNLIKNAVKFTNSGTIDFGYNILGNDVLFYVSDTGIGIPEKMQERIFERFVQADISFSRNYEGAGLGLAISKSYVEALGGKIWFTTKESVGSTFYFTLPLDAHSFEVKGALIAKNLEETIRQRKMKILIAEDDSLSMLYLQNLLEPIAFKLYYTNNGTDAVKMAKENPDIDAILMDIRMPDISGIEATRQIRKFNKKVTIIAQTAFAFTNDKISAIYAGCNDYITKPVLPNELFKVLDKWLISNADN